MVQRGVIIQKDIIATVNNKENFNIYMKELKGFDKLTREEEFDLFKSLREGDTKLRDKLIGCNLLFVVSVAKQYQSMTKGALTLEDLISEGNYGLCKAFDTYNYEMGFKFISYAVFSVKQYILLSISKNIKLIKIPSKRQRMLYELNMLERDLEQQNGYHVDCEELANYAVEKGTISTFLAERNATSLVSHLKNESQFESSLNRQIDMDGGDEMISLIADINSEMPDDKIKIKEYKTKLEAILNSVPNGEYSETWGNSPKNIKKMLELYYGIGIEKSLTYKEIAPMFDLQPERIRQLIKKYIRFLTHKYRFNRDAFAEN